MPSLAAVLALMLSGCAVGPDYSKPDVAMPVAYKTAEPADAPVHADTLPQNWKAAQPADARQRAPWWEIYGDPQLNALEERVASANQTVAAASARFRGARAAVAQARSAYFPTVTANAAFNQSRASSNILYKSSAGVTVPDYLVDAQISWEPDLWGRISRAVEGGRAGAQASAADLQSAILSMQAELASNYFELRGTVEEERLLKETLQAYDKALALTRDRFAGGIAAESDVAQAEEQLRSTQAQLIDLETARASLVNAIAILVGEPPSSFTLDVEPLDEGHAPRPSAALAALPLSVPSALLERRPDIAAAERRVAEANARVGVATAAFFPNLLLAATGGLEATNFSSWLMAPSRFWSLGPQLAFTALDFGGRAAARDAARATYDESVADYRQTVLTAFGQVEDNLNALEVLRRESEAQRDAVDAAKRALSKVGNRYENGAITYLNVVVTQAIVLSDQRTEVRIERRRMAASVALIKALGGGWTTAALPDAEEVSRQE
ncbi:MULTISPECIES: efflux transporter outer membrane subunit [unclassified Caballeronia]|uniref:efflux transporter outer membrane subunit n=1 Tax=unclassified Caballeronia TaxID=2646786 RepID=UPI002854C44F|nr:MULTISPECIES: efflux transporter outer membrane subunit [unclassified Caballeronia]MDR5771548.1 efflux transporter outer membrane subunit [Caballeronia sp. LZ002]MDR5846984.1 efflux transporter outer membrane subunit [Caballeronia sp. LZ003]